MAQTSSVSTLNPNDHSNCAAQRRRQLFPAIEEDIDDLGHISPLSSSSPPDSPVHLPLRAEYTVTKYNAQFNKSTIADYIILENINDLNKNDCEKSLETPENTPSETNTTPLSNKHFNNEINMSPLYLSPVQMILQSPVVLSPKKYKLKPEDDTPSRKSLMQALKTPQDSSSLNTDVPKLIRKVSMDSSSTDVEYGKRKMPFSESPQPGKQLKLDPGSKVRTVLFPKPEAVSTASFYSKLNHSNLQKVLKSSNKQTKKIKKKSSSLYLCGRKLNKKQFGEINAGVRHKIRKPKPKKIVQEQFLKAALGILDNSPLNDYLNEIRNMYASSNQKQITPLSDEQLVPSNFVSEYVEREFQDHTEPLEDKLEDKREHSPPPDPNKKFFKFKRSSATVTVDKHMKLKMDDGKLSLMEGKRASKVQKIEWKLNLDVTDLTVPEHENLISSEKIDEILFTLDSNEKENYVGSVQTVDTNKQVLECKEQFVLKAHNSVTMSENAIHLHVPSESQCGKSNSLSPSSSLTSKQVDQESILLSPTSQMCSMTSGLALNSPKKAVQNITNILDDSQNNSHMIPSALDMEQQKLFSIFYGTQNTPPKKLKAPKNAVTSKKFKLLPRNQMLLDAGQKRFGVSQCPECKFVYHMGDPNEELMHLNYHNAGSVLRFNGWKDEHLVAQFPNAKIIRVFPSDPKPWVKKVKDLVEVINRDLGYYEMPVTLDNTQIYLYIKNKTITGCLIAEPQTTAYRMLSDDSGIDLCSEKSYPIKCGVNRIWVLQSHRKEGIGTCLLNSLRGNFMFGSILNKDDIALSSPTEAGKAFATKYFNTANFLIYT